MNCRPGTGKTKFARELSLDDTIHAHCPTPSTHRDVHRQLTEMINSGKNHKVIIYKEGY